MQESEISYRDDLSNAIESVSLFLSDLSGNEVKLLSGDKLKILNMFFREKLYGPIYYDNFNIYVFQRDDKDIILSSHNNLRTDTSYYSAENGYFIESICYINSNEIYSLLSTN